MQAMHRREPPLSKGISETRKSQAVGADLFRWSTLMQWLGDHEVGDEVDRKLSKIKESELPVNPLRLAFGNPAPLTKGRLNEVRKSSFVLPSVRSS